VLQGKSKAAHKRQTADLIDVLLILDVQARAHCAFSVHLVLGHPGDCHPAQQSGFGLIKQEVDLTMPAISESRWRRMTPTLSTKKSARYMSAGESGDATHKVAPMVYTLATTRESQRLIHELRAVSPDTEKPLSPPHDVSRHGRSTSIRMAAIGPGEP
jgi:hypothetical protein